MDNVEVFDSAIEAIRAVKGLSKTIERQSEKVYLAYCEYDARWYVTDDSFDLGRAIHERWGGDGDPDNEKDSWKVWEYSMAVRMEKFPHTYRKAKRVAFESIIPLIRLKRSVGCEYSVDFTIE